MNSTPGRGMGNAAAASPDAAVRLLRGSCAASARFLRGASPPHPAGERSAAQPRGRALSASGAGRGGLGGVTSSEHDCFPQTRDFFRLGSPSLPARLTVSLQGGVSVPPSPASRIAFISQ